MRDLRQAPTAPGTTVMQSKAPNARRSRFCAVMYSSACQRVSRLMRLPTLALPATAPIDLSPNQRVRRAMVSRFKMGIGVERDDNLAMRRSQARY